jgi:hypothetical protein
LSKNKTFIGVSETYDFIVTIPEDGKIEYRIMAQDGSRLRLLGSGKILAAQVVPRPDKIGMIKMAKMDMKMGAHALNIVRKKDERFKIKEEYGMQMDMSRILQ